MDAFDVNVKDFQGGSVVIRVYPTWNVSEVKREIASRTNVNPQDFRIVFAGQTLADSQTLWDIGLQGYSTLHCIRDRMSSVGIQMGPPGPTLNHVAGALGDMAISQGARVDLARSVSSSSANSQERGSSSQEDHRFYVYCKRPCGNMTPGKLRVRCADCKDSSFVLTHGPGSWEDVLETRKLHGQCNNEACGRHDAEFFFKCSNHPTEEREDSVALHMVRANTIEVECATCLDVRPVVVVFGCQEGHCLCVQCFIQYCQHQLVNRQFIQDSRGKGYTIRCPANCTGSEITEIHHFRLMGKNQAGQDLYAKYQKFGTEECIIQMGGVLCPQRNCGQGLLPEEGRRVQCPRISGGCGFVFCRNCKRDYHDGPCRQTAPETQQGAAFRVNPENLERARWIEANERYIQNNTNIKPCPKCQVPIEKNGGCMHMTCTLAQCKYEWCWICGIEWNRNCQSSHWFG